MYSQFDEEKVITEFFGDHVGTFLDVGASDGIEMSNTRRLLELGWRGVLVEPAARQFVKLMDNNRAYADKVMLFNTAVADTNGLNRIYMDESRDWANTISKDLVDAGHIKEPSNLFVQVSAVTIAELAAVSGYWDFISLDAEWEDLSIMQEIPRRVMMHCKLICVEACHVRHEMVRLLSGHRFQVIHETPPNIIAKRI